MSEKPTGFLHRISSSIVAQVTAFRISLRTWQWAFRLIIAMFFIMLSSGGSVALLFIHPTDSLTSTFFEQWPRWEFLLFLTLISAAMIYGFTEAIVSSEYGSSRWLFALNFYLYSVLRLFVLLMLVTCIFLLYFRDTFADEEILRSDLSHHYSVILWDAFTFDFTVQWHQLIPGTSDFVTLDYRKEGIYGGLVRLFKVAYIFSVSTAVHKSFVFKTPDERFDELERRWKEHFEKKSKQTNE